MSLALEMSSRREGIIENMSMKMVSINIEGQKHLDTVRDFLTKENPDIVCLMEVCEEDLDSLLFNYLYRVFGANFKLKTGEVIGVALASSQPIAHSTIFYADNKAEDDIPLKSLGGHRPVMVGGETRGVKIGAVHFTWTPRMSESVQQQQDLDRLMAHLDNQEMILCGDFNIPRGNATYQKLAAKYRDNIPTSVKSTIDWELHRAKREGREKFEVVVDYIWSTPGYIVSEVRVESGVSDHCAIVCEIDFYGKKVIM